MMFTGLKGMFTAYSDLIILLLVSALASYITYAITDSSWQASYSKLELQYAQASEKAIRDLRAREKQYETDKQNLLLEAKQKQAQAQQDVVVANASVERLRQRINKLLANTSPTVTGATARGKTATEAVNMLSNVLEKSIERNRQLASFADSAYNAGTLCEKSYDALQPK